MSFLIDKAKRREGFTLIELSLSVAFIGILSIIIVLLINNTISTYRRGVTLNRLNSSGMDIVDDIRSTIQSSPSSELTRLCEVYYGGQAEGSSAAQNKELNKCISDGARGFVSVVRTAEVRAHNTNKMQNVPVYGAFCTGSYSYIWNSGYFFSSDHKVGPESEPLKPATLKYRKIGDDSHGGSKDRFKLLKVEDPGRSVCISSFYGEKNKEDVVESPNQIIQNKNYNPNGQINSFNGKFDISSYDGLSEDPVDLISVDQGNDLAVYDLRSSAPAGGASNYGLFYSVSLILGTTRGGIDIMSSGNFCVPPEDYDKGDLIDSDYCAINKFNFAVQANGG